MKRQIIALLLVGTMLILPLASCGSTASTTSNVDADKSLADAIVDEAIKGAVETAVDHAVNNIFNNEDKEDEYEIDTGMLPDGGIPIMSVEEAENIGSSVPNDKDIDETEIPDWPFRVDEYDYVSAYAWEVTIDDIDFKFPMTVKDLEAIDDWNIEYYAEPDELEKIEPGSVFVGSLNNGKKEIEFKIVNNGLDYCSYEDCAVKSVSAVAYPWMYDEEKMEMSTLNGITLGMTKDEVRDKFKDVGLEEMDTSYAGRLSFVEMSDNRFTVGEYSFTFDEDILYGISVEYIGK